MKNQVLTPPPPYKLLLLLGIFAITLSACSSGGGDSDNGSSNSAPSVSAGEDQTVNQGATVNLTGVASDSDGSISSWLWQQTSGSHSVTIKNSTTSNASFTAPEVEAETILVFELEVKDNDGASVSDSMRVTVRGPGDSVNPLPDDFKAEAGDTQVTLSWSHYSSATDYNIYRSSASDCELANYTSCASGALFTSKSTPFTDTGLTNDTTYYYWIEAILEGVTYLDEEKISAMPVDDEDDDDIDLTNGLVAHYEFEGDADDSSGNDNDGEEFGGVSYTDGITGSAFDSNPELKPYYKLDGEFDTNNIKTVAVWIYQYGRHDMDQRQILFSKYDWSNNRNFFFSTFDNTDDHSRFCAYFYNTDQEHEKLCSYYDDDELSELSETITMHQNNEMNDGQWYHLSYTDDGSKLSIYINGTRVSEKIKEYSTYLNSSPPVYIGYARNIGDDFSYEDFLNAKIDDFRVYNRALNAAEIQTLYELGED